MAEDTDTGTFRIARLGIEVEAWFRTKVGLYVLERAEREVEEAFSDWLDTPPEDQTPELHRRANAARDAVAWLNDAIADGEAAHRDLQEEEDNG